MGKAMVIDEGTRFNNDFVMVKIACRNVNLVPPSVESTLGLFLYDFYFEREEPNEEDHDPLAAKITTNANGHQPSPMKQKRGEENRNANTNAGTSGGMKEMMWMLVGPL